MNLSFLQKNILFVTKYQKILVFFVLFFCHDIFASSQAQTNPISHTPAPKMNLIDSLLSASIIVQITLLILIIMSVVSWAIILQKYFFFKEAKKACLKLEDVFFKDGSFEDIYIQAKSCENSALSQIFMSGYNEMQKIFQNKTLDTKTPPVNSVKYLDNVERALRKSCENELSLLEKSLSFLASVAGSGPFIGLFGTVFGIMNSFNKIAAMGSASLNVVAPGISEALLATGIGLFAAIPASIFYNNYLTQIKQFELQFNNFITDFLNISKRNFFKAKE